MTEGSQSEIRLTDANRDEVVSQLSLAMSEGRLDLDEFEQRSRLVYESKVPSDLSGVLEGLPVTNSPAVRAAPAVARSATSKPNNRWFFSLIGDRTQRGLLDLGEKTTSIALLGDTTFDLTKVTDDVDLRIASLIGDATVIVRPGTVVASSIFHLLGDRTEETSERTTAAPITVRLKILALIGDVKIQVVDD